MVRQTTRKCTCNTAGRLLALYVTNSGSISSILYGPPSLPRVTLSTELGLSPKFYQVWPKSKQTKNVGGLYFHFPIRLEFLLFLIPLLFLLYQPEPFSANGKEKSKLCLPFTTVDVLSDLWALQNRKPSSWPFVCKIKGVQLVKTEPIPV